jgi:hypothetical protein
LQYTLAEVFNGRETGVTQCFSGKDSKPDFNLVKPRAMLWRVGKANPMFQIGQKGLAGGEIF